MISHTRTSASLAYALFLLTSFTVAASDYTTLTASPDIPLQTPASSIGLYPLTQTAQESAPSGVESAPISASSNRVHALNFSTIVWEITDDLSLTIKIGDWRLSQDKVFDTLSAADSAVGKKPAAGALEEKFTQKTGSRINAMLFEIGPGYEDRRLTWGEVGEILGARGLPAYFRQEKIWRDTHFEVFDFVRGKLGEGAVRKWYHFQVDGNATLASDDLATS